MKERVRYMLDYLGLGPSSFADNLGVQRSSISHLLSGRNKPGVDFLEKLSIAYPLINVEWLITGSGHIKKETDAPQPQTQLEYLDYPGLTEQVPEDITTDIPESKTEKTLPSKGKKLVKVILLYEDGSFESYTTP